jgi:hypothetical protein
LNLKPVDPNAVGYLLDELKNDITRETPASFEPSIDYVVTKIPCFAFEKFPASRSLSANPNGIQIHQPRVGGPRRTGDPCRMGHQRLPWETVPQIPRQERGVHAASTSANQHA